MVNNLALPCKKGSIPRAAHARPNQVVDSVVQARMAAHFTPDTVLDGLSKTSTSRLREARSSCFRFPKILAMGPHLDAPILRHFLKLARPSSNGSAQQGARSPGLPHTQGPRPEGHVDTPVIEQAGSLGRQLSNLETGQDELWMIW